MPEYAGLPVEHATCIGAMTFTHHALVLWAGKHGLFACNLGVFSSEFGVEDCIKVSEGLTDDGSRLTSRASVTQEQLPAL